MDPNKTLQEVDQALGKNPSIYWKDYIARGAARRLQYAMDRHGFKPTNVDTYPRAWEYVQSLNTKEEE